MAVASTKPDWRRGLSQLWSPSIGLALIGFLLAFFLTRPPTPSVTSVDGTYVNSCCAPIRLSKGVLIAGKIRLPFKLRDMKYGLEAVTNREVQVGVDNSILSVQAPNMPESVILFDQDRRGFVLPRGRDAEFDFRAVRGGR